MSFAEWDPILSAHLLPKLSLGLYVSSSFPCLLQAGLFLQSLGCVPALPGYFKAMKAVCERHGALLIMDEVMSGMGRTGTLHAWEQEGVSPDIQAIGKCLGGGYAPIAGILVGKKVVDVLDKGTGAFSHGQTYQGHPVACAAAFEVQSIIKEQNLIQNCHEMGQYLGKLLTARLDAHPRVGNVRGRGLFWGVSPAFSLPMSFPS